MEEPKLLQVQATEVNKTYIGAAFCSDEDGLRGVYVDMDPHEALDINQARQAVRHGETINTVTARYNLNRTVRGNIALLPIVLPCLERIEAGNCQAYSKE